MSSEFLFDTIPPSCYKTGTSYGFTHPEKLRDRPCDASATVQAVPTSADNVREMRDDMRSACRLSFERLFVVDASSFRDSGFLSKQSHSYL